MLLGGNLSPSMLEEMEEEVVGTLPEMLHKESSITDGEVSAIQEDRTVPVR
jgi:hypothetical protein